MEENLHVRAFLSLGSNLGDREGNLHRALGLLESGSGVKVTTTSSLYETRPVGVTEQPDFINLVAEVETSLDPHQLLRRCLGVENEMGRVREAHWGPRLIDVDVLLFGEEVSQDDELVLPHPEMLNRAFVLVPLLEIAPDLAMPDGRSIAGALEALPEEERSGVARRKVEA